MIGQVHHSETRCNRITRCKSGNRKSGAECLNISAEQEQKAAEDGDGAREAQSVGLFNDFSDLQGREEGRGGNEEPSGAQGTELVDTHGGMAGKEQVMGQRGVEEKNT